VLYAAFVQQQCRYDVMFALELDAETYYTVAHQLLVLLTNLLPRSEAKKLRREPLYKTIAVIRNHLVRHAYGGKPDNDPRGGFVLIGRIGIMLKGGNVHPSGERRDPGFYPNREALLAVLKKYRIEAFAPLPPQLSVSSHPAT